MHAHLILINNSCIFFLPLTGVLDSPPPHPPLKGFGFRFVLDVHTWLRISNFRVAIVNKGPQSTTNLPSMKEMYRLPWTTDARNTNNHA